MTSRRWQWLIIIGGLVLAVRQGVRVWQLYKSGEQVRLAQEQVRQEEQRNQQLEQRLAEIDNPVFVEKEAREKLGYVREGETIVIVPSAPPVSPVDQLNDEPNWRKWWDLYIRL